MQQSGEEKSINQTSDIEAQMQTFFFFFQKDGDIGNNFIPMSWECFVYKIDIPSL